MGRTDQSICRKRTHQHRSRMDKLSKMAKNITRQHVAAVGGAFGALLVAKRVTRQSTLPEVAEGKKNLVQAGHEKKVKKTSTNQMATTMCEFKDAPCHCRSSMDAPTTNCPNQVNKKSGWIW